MSIDTTTIDNFDVSVSGPGYSNQQAIASSLTGSGASVTATYTIPAPVNGWGSLNPSNTFNVGTYTISMNQNQIADLDSTSHFSPAGTIGTFATDFAITLTVDTSSDAVDDNYSLGKLSLREAVSVANNSLGADTINFNFASPMTITLDSGLQLNRSVLIQGPGADRLRLDAKATARHFTIGEGSDVQIAGLTLANGKATNGGAINCPFGSTLAVDGVWLVGNDAFGTLGGAIYTQSALTIKDSTFSQNSANNGGAVYLYAVGASVSNSTFSSNTAGTRGGAIAGDLATNATVKVRNSTIAQNTASGTGGGVILSAAFFVLFELESSIVAGNVATVDFAADSTVASVVKDSIIGKTTFTNFSSTNSLIGTTTNPIDAKLTPLGNFGGPMPTHGFLAGSPAIDAGSNPDNLVVDQRGFARSVGSKTDMGAFEYQGVPYVGLVVFGDGTNQRSNVKQIVVTFSEAVNFMGDVASAFTLTRTGAASNVVLSANLTTGPASTVTITFSGSFTEAGGSLVDGTYDFMISAAQVSGVGGALDGNNDGTPGGSYSVTGSTANKFFRRFGDSNGSGAVDFMTDFMAFRAAFANGGPSTVFDFDGDGDVDFLVDFIAFRSRYSSGP